MSEAGEDRPGVVVLGAGYGGLRAALTLARMEATRDGLPVTLVDRGDLHQLITELHRVATGHLAPEAAALSLPSLLRGSGIRFRQEEVTALDLDGRRVQMAGGGSLPYSHLVIALGSDVDDHGLPGARDHALGLKSVGDARRIWEHLRETVEQAGQVTDPAERAALATIVVVGAGWTGTELAGELASLASQVRQQSPDLHLHIMLLEAGVAIMPRFSPRLVQAARRFFRDNGVDLRLRQRVVAVESGRVLLESGGAIAARTVIWTAGVRGVSSLRRGQLPLDGSHRVQVDTFLRVAGYPEVYVVGDAALPPVAEGSDTPGTSAQVALHQGELAAANIAASLTGRAALPYRPAFLGEALSLGLRDGAVTVGPLLVRGRRALGLKRAISLNYVYSLGGSAALFDALGHGL